jgi:site-specific DNA-methyltransferase (adenine-specific)
VTRVETIGDATLYLGDCRDILPTLGKVDAVVTDPPYGIGYAASPVVGRNRASKKYDKRGWDDETPDIASALSAGGDAIIWGGNYFPLPPARCWLIWHKPDIAPSLSPVELAWTTLDRSCGFYRYSISATGLERVEAGSGHPTQKPLPLMAWCLDLVPHARSIVDPYMGSGTTGVACAKAGRRFIGIEREPPYFDIACRRIAEAYRQPRLFEEPAPKPVQPSLLGPALSGGDAEGGPYPGKLREAS